MPTLPFSSSRLSLAGAFILTLVLLPACASSGERERAPRGSADHIIQAEIEAANLNNAMELVERLRPNWLRGRGQTSIMGGGSDTPVVYIENTRFGDTQSLQGIEARSIIEMRFIRAADATTRWGTGHAGGVIQITMRSGR